MEEILEPWSTWHGESEWKLEDFSFLQRDSRRLTEKELLEREKGVEELSCELQRLMFTVTIESRR